MTDNSYDLKLNGWPVVFEVRLVTEQGEGWRGQQQVAVCETIQEVNKVLQTLEVPPYWMVDIELQDKYPNEFNEDE